LWYKDSSAGAGDNNTGFAVRQSCIIQKPDPKGTFSFRVPLKHVFGFCDDYDKFVYGFKHQPTLVSKGDDNDAILNDNAAAAAKVVQEKLSWFMLHVLPADAEKLALYRTIESKASLPVMYWMIQCDSTEVPQTRQFAWRLSMKSIPEKPGWVSDWEVGKRRTKPLNFDHCNLTNMFVMLISRRYPEIDYENNFT